MNTKIFTRLQNEDDEGTQPTTQRFQTVHPDYSMMSFDVNRKLDKIDHKIDLALPP